jgi:hypothetical protein
MPDIKHAIQISAEPEQVYPLVATARLCQWWATDITEPDGAVELGFFNRAAVYRLRPTFEEPPAQTEWVCESGDEWRETRLGFRLEASNTGTQLRFTHAGWRTESGYFVSCNTTWGTLMFRLKAAAEGKSPGPLFSREGWAD